MAGNNPTTKFKVDISELKAGITEANRQIKLARSEFKAASSGMQDWEKSADGLSAKIKELSAVEDAEKRKLQALKQQYELVAAEQGENSKGAQDLAIKINNQTAAVNKVQNQLSGYTGKLQTVQKAEELAARKGIDFNDALSYIESDAGGAEKSVEELSDSFDDAQRSMKNVDEAADDTGDGFTILKGSIASLIADGIKSLITSLAAAIEESREYRAELGMLQATAETTGVSFNTAKKNLAEVTAITNDSGAAVEGLNNLMSAGFDGSALDKITDQLVGASIKWKDTLKFEGLSDGLQETLATGAAVGPFAELLERGGMSLDTFNSGLSKCSSEAQKQQFVLQQLDKLGLTKVKESYEKNNKSLIDSQKAQIAWNDAMAQVSTKVEPIFARLKQVAADALTLLINNLPTIISLLKAAAVAVGAYVAYTTAITVMKNGWMALTVVQKAVTAAQKLMNLAMSANPMGIVIAAITGLVTAFVMLWNKSESFRQFWINLWDNIKVFCGKAIDGIVNFFKELPGKIWTFLKQVISRVTTWGSSLITRGKSAASSFVNSVISFIKGLPGKMWNLLVSAASKVVSWGSSLASKGASAAKKLFNSVVNGIKGLPGKLKSIGSDLVKGLWNGISNMAGWIKNKIAGFGKGVLNDLKDFFGIHSPSKVMANEVGRFLPEGIAVGIDNYAKKAILAAKDMKNKIVDVTGFGDVSVPTLQGGGYGGAPGSIGSSSNVQNITFNQVNNSPKYLSRLDIYRQTKNQIRQLKGI